MEAVRLDYNAEMGELEMEEMADAIWDCNEGGPDLTPAQVDRIPLYIAALEGKWDAWVKRADEEEARWDRSPLDFL